MANISVLKIIAIIILIPLFIYEWYGLINNMLTGNMATEFIYFFIIIRVGIAYWIYNDLKKREGSILWVIAFLIGFIGLIIYLVWRPQRKFKRKTTIDEKWEELERRSKAAKHD